MRAGQEKASTRTATKSGYIIQQAEARDEPILLQLLERYVTTQGAARRYDWIYKQNPQGQAETWLACEPMRGQIVGFTSIFAREFLVAGERVVGGVGFDAFVRPDHRRRGIALALHRASHAAMRDRKVPYHFMCGPPVTANLHALIKAGSQVVGGVRYLGLPLTVRGLLEMLHYRGAYAEKLAARATFFDSLLARARRIISGTGEQVSVRPVDSINSGFDRLWEEIAPHFSVIGRRDGEYLYWRYLQNPVCRQQLVALEQRGKLLGWAALEFAPQGCLLVDYLLPLESKSAGRALKALIGYVAKQDANRLTLRFNLKGLYTGLFLRHGFFPGWSVELFQVLCANDRLLAVLFDPSGWHFSNGDLNPESSPWSVNTAPQAVWADPNYICANWPPENSPDLLLELQPHAQGSEL